MVSSKKVYPKKSIQGVVIAGMIAVFLVAGYASWNQFERHGRITSEVAILEAEKERVRRENESLRERISYFATENFQEQESKERLNMRKDNEFVIDIERIEQQRVNEEKNVIESDLNQEPIPNYKKWWSKIF